MASEPLALRTEQIMMQSTRWWAGLLVVVLAGPVAAQDKKPFEKHDASALNNALRDVINTGAKMFNDQGDHAGCYRLYQGSLLTVRPFLAPDMQKRVDDGLAAAEKLPFFADRAFELRKVLDDIRGQTKGGTAGGPTGDKGQVSGKLTLEGKPVAGGYFVTLIADDGKKFSSAINKVGEFQFKTPIPAGDYRVAIEPIPTEKGVALPARYASEATSGLSIRVQAGKSLVNLELVK
jgi:hypothetical protein